ncbi:prolyl 4-hydroxylase subunit alpha-1-like [Portunus trituberculatus]|uniref:prolyl 4-hydroxylase subunit alpha-1-like n=1 Tax=Portunus trituberculatus TaxID=210409 RepID=UPI001E1D2085|nr:prolyl 4-hydroxylase subunit alpha-1-like [Portunus trituberculatus]XP_045138532.1 prolyl 4-hydroxylase subunit alpha-1-like [Portunus trituberculatus]XP_045138533.1 prolyl 4-hydroxylase subunit alpha-1-like [Portunus trituberculatus]XP_045138534.1 prolyl 4-hydroxylase subunit alpha-1-like [Portunus trituberculatus]
MWRVLACVALMAVAGPQATTGEVYTSIQDLTAVFSLERRVVSALSNYVDDMEAKLLRIRKYLREYEQVSAEGTVTDEVTMERLAGNPVHAFHLMKRLTVDWRHLEEQSKVDPWMDVMNAMRGVGGGGVRLPNEEDLQGAAQALVRLHDVYNLNTTQLARGNVWGVQSAAELTAQDCLYMGKHSFNLGLYQRAVQWFEEAYALAGLEGNATVTQDQVNVFLNTAIKALDDNPYGQLEIGQQENFSARTSLQEKPSVSHRLATVLTPQEDAANFHALCRGQQLLSDAYVATLKCFYDWRGDHYLRLMPARVERHHWSPELLTFHQVISDNEILKLQQLSAPALSRAMVQGPQGKGNTVSNTRTSKVGWLDDSQNPLVAKLSDRVARLTRLSTSVTNDDAEMLQVANYGIGGHYNPHHDYLLVDKTEEELNNIHPRELVLGDRIATFMFYLSDVTRGGATAFPRLGTAVWPSKGSAAFWYNLKRSGQGSQATLHGACPVVHGSKWVSNKWIRERGQFLRRTCGLSPDE